VGRGWDRPGTLVGRKGEPRLRYQREFLVPVRSPRPEGERPRRLRMAPGKLGNLPEPELYYILGEFGDPPLIVTSSASLAPKIREGAQVSLICVHQAPLISSSSSAALPFFSDDLAHPSAQAPDPSAACVPPRENPGTSSQGRAGVELRKLLEYHAPDRMCLLWLPGGSHIGGPRWRTFSNPGDSEHRHVAAHQQTFHRASFAS